MEHYLDTIKRVMNGDFEHATEEEKQRAVKDVIQICSTAAAAVTIQPIPFMDMVLLSPIQIALVQSIARVYGHSLDKKSVLEILSTFGASLVTQGVIMSAAKFVPFIGWLVTTSMAYALTYAVGEVSDHYFKNGRGVPTEDLKTMFERIYKSKKEEKQDAHKKNPTLKERLEQLRDARKDGLLDDEEFEAKKREILAEF
jgi:uncharacterized protein (DUF697 family)